jgi:hypothetical protein
MLTGDPVHLHHPPSVNAQNPNPILSVSMLEAVAEEVGLQPEANNPEPRLSRSHSLSSISIYFDSVSSHSLSIHHGGSVCSQSGSGIPPTVPIPIPKPPNPERTRAPVRVRPRRPQLSLATIRTIHGHETWYKIVRDISIPVTIVGISLVVSGYLFLKFRVRKGVQRDYFKGDYTLPTIIYGLSL